METKTRIAITIDPNVLERIDHVCEARGEARSAYVERVLRNSLRDEESYLREMESPVWRAIYSKLANPAALTVLAQLVGDSLSDEQKREIVKAVEKDSKLGKERAAKKRTKRKEAKA